MDLALSFAIFGVLFAIATAYYKFALLDHRYPSKSPAWFSIAWPSLVLTLVNGLAVGSLQSNPTLSVSVASVSVGLLCAPAIAPPLYVSKEIEPVFAQRLLIQLRSIISAYAVQKVIAVLVFLVCSIFTDAWYFVAATVAGVLLCAKSATLAAAEAGNGLPTPATAKRWSLRCIVAVLCFSLLWAYCPYVILSESKAAPETWSAFAGLGIGALLSIFTAPAGSRV